MPNETDPLPLEGLLPKRERTRRALIAAAAELVAERGYESTSMAAVAERAGMSRGAIYGNFADREELFLAVAERLWRPISPDFEPGTSAPERMRRLGEAVAREADARRAVAVGALSFQLYALRDPSLGRRLAAANEVQYRAAAERLAADVPPADLPVRPEAFVKTLHALIEGLLLTHALTPELVTADVIRSAFEMVAASISPSRLARSGCVP